MSELRERLARLKKLAAEKRGIGVPPPLPWTIVCGRHGEYGETRPAGVYWKDNGQGGRFPEVVYEPADDEDKEGEEIDRHILQIQKELGAPDSWLKHLVVIIAGPEHVPPPLDLPRD